ncbi:MAG: hypothetical protein HYZ14_09325 [Bacteroidetes bacterium]|nr:hypothetical protein [Bacteroidota bacterium]
MKNAFYVLTIGFAATLVTACSEETVVTQEKPIPQLIIGDPADYGSDSLIVFPVGMTYIVPEQNGEKKLENGSDAEEGYETEHYAADEVVNEANGRTTYNYNVKMQDQGLSSNSYGSYQVYENLDVENVDIRNLIFYNKFTGESKKLLDEKLHIISFSIHYEFGDEPIIMYDVVKNDYNEDSLYNSSDPVMLFISDMSGANFTQLTPEDETYLTYFYYSESNRLLLKVSKDGDGNKAFDPYDQTIFREVDLKNPAMGETLFGEDMIQDLMDQL